MKSLSFVYCANRIFNVFSKINKLFKELANLRPTEGHWLL